MLRLLSLLLLLVFVAAPARAQEDTVSDGYPTLIGGFNALAQEMRYPEAAKAAGDEGTVFVQFVVDEEGRTDDAEVLLGVSEALDAEALRVVQQARFTPGRADGKPVSMQLTLPIKFVLPAQKIKDR